MKIFVRYFFFSIVFLASCSKSDNTVKEEEGKEEETKEVTTTVLVDEEFHGTTEMHRTGTNQPIADFIPVGIAVEPNKTLELDVELTSGSDLPLVLLGTYSRYVSDWNPKEKQLVVGKNTVVNNSTKTRLVYIRYTGEMPDSQAKITITGGKEIPFYKINETKNEDFVASLDNCDCTNAQLYGEKSIVVASVANMKKYKNQDWNDLLVTLDKIIEVESKINGLDDSSPTHAPNKNRFLLTESDDPNFWMAATWFRTFYNQNDAIDFVIDINKLKNDGWGPWHELGHQNQLGNLTWDHVVEVTVNIYSLAVERHFGNESRLKRDNVWALVDNYLNLPLDQRDFNGDGTGLFVRLALYQQLWLHYGDDFFIDLHKKTREEQATLTTNEEKMAYFMLKASEVSGNNLKDFFKKWGFILADTDFDALDALGLPEPSLDLTTLRE